MRGLPSPTTLISLLVAAGYTQALNLNLNDTSSIKSATKTIVSNILSIYGDPSTPGFIPGVFPSPYYWGEAGLAFDSLVNYWALTGDDSYVNITRDALVFQTGPAYNYVPLNQTADEGNDDQSTWGLAAMTAAENQFPAPSNNLSWVQLAQNVFDSQTARWDAKTCAGGLRWQIYVFNNGYTYKNTESNGRLAELAARLAHFTGNETYSEWASKVVDWTTGAGLLTSSGSVFDGADTTGNCTDIDQIQWTATSGLYMATAAYMSNVTGASPSWDTLLTSLLSKVEEIFVSSNSTPGVLYESACMPSKTCDVDQLAFRATLARALANTYTLTAGQNSTSDLRSKIATLVQNSAVGAAAQCSGGSNGTLCGQDWTSSTWDGTSGLGQDLSALEIILANLPATQEATANSTQTTNDPSSPSSIPPTNVTVVAQTPPKNGASGLTSSVLLSVLGLSLAALL